MASFRVEVTTPQGGPTVARISGAEFPVEAWSAQPDESGRVLLTMVVAPDDVEVNTVPTEPHPAEPARSPGVSHWGDGSHPDPRANIPGWEPEQLGPQFAGHAEGRALNGQVTG